MNLKAEQEANDRLRTTFKGGQVLMTPTVHELLPELRGRMLYRLSLYDRFHPESAHDEGVLIFAGYTWYWKIEMSEGVRTLSIYLKEDLLLPMRDTPPRASR